MSSIDINFRIGQSEIGKSLKALCREIISKKIVFIGSCSLESVEQLNQLMESTLPDSGLSIEDMGSDIEGQERTKPKRLAWGFFAAELLNSLVEMEYDHHSPAKKSASRRKLGQLTAGLAKDIKNMVVETESETMEWNVSEQYSILGSILKDSEISQEVASS